MMQNHAYDISYGFFLKIFYKRGCSSEIIVDNPTATISLDKSNQFQGKG